MEADVLSRSWKEFLVRFLRETLLRAWSAFFSSVLFGRKNIRGYSISLVGIPPHKWSVSKGKFRSDWNFITKLYTVNMWGHSKIYSFFVFFQRWTQTTPRWRSRFSSSSPPCASTAPRDTTGPWRPSSTTRRSSRQNLNLNKFHYFHFRLGKFQVRAVPLQAGGGRAEDGQGRRLQDRSGENYFTKKNLYSPTK